VTDEPPGHGEPVSAANVSVMTGAGGDPLAAELRQELGDALVEVGSEAELDGAAAPGASARRELTILVRREDVATVAAALRSRFRYTLLVDLCAVDYPERPLRFEVVYHLYSFRENRRIRVKVRVADHSPVPSVTGIWRGAAWPEREAHDLFGIDFEGHPGLGRILLWEGFDGHPLRKDFPLAGIGTGAALEPAPHSPGEALATWPPAAAPAPPARGEPAAQSPGAASDSSGLDAVVPAANPPGPAGSR
jgi:NADH-quinone oxidoreductase subunit C